MFDKTIKEYTNKQFDQGEFADQELHGYSFEHCNFQGMQMNDLITRSCTFTDCVFRFAQLDGSEHHHSAFVNCRFTEASMFSATFDECKCIGSIFSGANATGLTIKGGNYSYAIMMRMDLKNADLHDINFSHADLRECHFEKANLRDANLSYALLQQADLSGTDIRGAVLDGVDMHFVKMKKTKIDIQQAVHIAECMGAVVL